MVQPKSVRQVMPIPETSGNCGVSFPRIPVVQRSVRGVDCPSMLKPDNVSRQVIVHCEIARLRDFVFIELLCGDYCRMVLGRFKFCTD